MIFALAILAVAAVGILGAIAGTVTPPPPYEPPRVFDYSEPPRDLRAVDASQRAAIEALTFTDPDERWDWATGQSRN